LTQIWVKTIQHFSVQLDLWSVLYISMFLLFVYMLCHAKWITVNLYQHAIFQLLVVSGYTFSRF